MEMNLRQFGRMETAVMILDSAYSREDNAAAGRAVGILRELLEDLSAVNENEMSFAEQADVPPFILPHDHMKLMARLKVSQGGDAKDILRELMKLFSLTNEEMARKLRINQGTLSHFLNEGTRAKTVVTALVNYANQED